MSPVAAYFNTRDQGLSSVSNPLIAAANRPDSPSPFGIAGFTGHETIRFGPGHRGPIRLFFTDQQFDRNFPNQRGYHKTEKRRDIGCLYLQVGLLLRINRYCAPVRSVYL
jgi:hypothetical protein